MTIPRALLQRLPKAELHCHLDGSLRPATLLTLAEARGVALPARDPAALAAAMVARDVSDLPAYLARFETTLAVLQDAPAIEQVAFELGVDLADDGVRYAEVRYCPALNTRGGLSPDAVLEASTAGLVRASAARGIALRTIVCALRSRSVPEAVALADLAVRWRDRGVVGFDLAGGEAGNPPERFVEAFDRARAGDLGITVHAGEAAGAASVRGAVQACGADRIGHGVRLADDPSLQAYVRDRRLHVEACLTSNVQTHAVPSLAAHPVRAYLADGLSVSLCTDNTLVSGVSLTDEYVAAVDGCGCGWDEVTALVVAGFEAAFLPWPERVALRDAARSDVAALRREAAA